MTKSPMHLTILFVALTLTLSISTVVQGAESSKAKSKQDPCLENSDKSDQILARILSLSELQRPFPEKREQLPKYCKETAADLELLDKQASQCAVESMKQLSKIMVYSSRSMMKRFCGKKKSNKFVDNLLAMAKCMNKITKEANTCFRTYMDEVQRSKRAQPASVRIGYFCCGTFKFTDCLIPNAEAKCGQQTAELVKDFIGNLISGMTNTACGEYTENSDKCDKLPAPPKRKKTDKVGRSFYIPMVELFNSLE